MSRRDSIGRRDRSATVTSEQDLSDPFKLLGITIEEGSSRLAAAQVQKAFGTYTRYLSKLKDPKYPAIMDAYAACRAVYANGKAIPLSSRPTVQKEQVINKFYELQSRRLSKNKQQETQPTPPLESPNEIKRSVEDELREQITDLKRQLVGLQEFLDSVKAQPSIQNTLTASRLEALQKELQENLTSAEKALNNPVNDSSVSEGGDASSVISSDQNESVATDIVATADIIIDSAESNNESVLSSRTSSVSSKAREASLNLTQNGDMSVDVLNSTVQSISTISSDKAVDRSAVNTSEITINQSFLTDQNFARSRTTSSVSFIQKRDRTASVRPQVEHVYIPEFVESTKVVSITTLIENLAKLVIVIQKDETLSEDKKAALSKAVESHSSDLVRLHRNEVSQETLTRSLAATKKTMMKIGAMCSDSIKISTVLAVIFANIFSLGLINVVNVNKACFSVGMFKPDAGVNVLNRTVNACEAVKDLENSLGNQTILVQRK